MLPIRTSTCVYVTNMMTDICVCYQYDDIHVCMLSIWWLTCVSVTNMMTDVCMLPIWWPTCVTNMITYMCYQYDDLLWDSPLKVPDNSCHKHFVTVCFKGWVGWSFLGLFHQTVSLSVRTYATVPTKIDPLFSVNGRGRVVVIVFYCFPQLSYTDRLRFLSIYFYR